MPEYNKDFAEKMHEELEEDVDDIHDLLRYYMDPDNEEEFVNNVLLLKVRLLALEGKVNALSNNLYR